MKKLVILTALALPGITVAGVNVNLDTPYVSVVRPITGSVDFTFTGTIDVLLSTFDVVGATVEFPGDMAANFLDVSFDPGFLTYLGAGAGVDYSGGIFIVTVDSTDPLGFYWLNGSGFGMSALSEVIIEASDGSVSAFDNEMFGVNVVPEPATLAAVGLGLAGLLRRRRKA